MTKILFALVLAGAIAHAGEISVPMKGANPKANDTVVFSEVCEVEKISLDQDNAKFELTDRKGKILIGTPWAGVKVSKGNEVYDLDVIHLEKEDPIALVKSGKFIVTGTAGTTMGCHRRLTFKIYPEDANPPCGDVAPGAMAAAGGKIADPMQNPNPKHGDTIAFTETCDQKKIPGIQGNVKAELTGVTGKMALTGSWSEVSLRKGNELYKLRVFHSSAKDPLVLLEERGVSGAPLVPDTCEHILKFKIRDATGVNPPCATGTNSNPIQWPAGR